MRKLLTCVVLIAFAATESLAWGPKGHQIVGDIARNRLTEMARQSITALLGNDDLSAVANWADEVRSNRPETYGWHFVDIPKGSSGFSQSRDCYQPDERRPTSKEDHHNCIVDRIDMFRQVLANKDAGREERIEALKFLVHFIGDIHQPMHAVLEARGGNDIHVVEFGSPQCGTRLCNLHYEWDVGLIEHTGRSEKDYVAYLEKLIQSKHWQADVGGTPADWANESLRLAGQAWLTEAGAVDEKYFQANIVVVDQRLAQAGLRLSATLNAIFSK
jgi:hypothetical protein